MDGPLPLRDPEAQKRMFKRRYNVAASRARDQMWVVYSLDPQIDLKPKDIRPRLIEHAIDPKAWERELEMLIAQADKRSGEFEPKVIRWLHERHYDVAPQYPVGA